ncbi:hypothetical protein ACFYT4_04280 [Streptomyces sp. NPDC004609]|uniref:hypothetical protein n=1 Tax=Streptomyces sp. NPDC004609 TaxID=3364704 RepID=UPI0036C06991
MWVALGLLYAAVPLVAWWLLARTRRIGPPVGAVLLTGAVVLVAVQHGWIPTYRADAHLVYAVCAALLLAVGTTLEGRYAGQGPEVWARRRSKAVGLVGVQLALTVCGSVLYSLALEASLPPMRAVPPLPPGLTVVGHHSSCGSGSCFRQLEIGSTTGLSREEIIRTLDRPHETCRANGWLLDRRDLCIGVDDSDERRVRIYVSLSNTLD